MNNWLFRVARVLHPFRDGAEIVELLRAATAGEAIKTGEIERAVERSKEAAWQPGSPLKTEHAYQWPQINVEQREAVIADAAGFGLVDFWEMSPVRFEDSEPHTEEIVDALFPGNPLLCVGRSNHLFATRTRDQWRGKLAEAQLIVPSPMCARFGHTQEGKESEHTLENTAPRRFLVLEQDAGSEDEQAAILLHLAQRGRLSLIVHSGGKSLHGWFFCEGVRDEELRSFMSHAVALGADRATWTRSQFRANAWWNPRERQDTICYLF
jgi:hypothetical protein